MSERLRCCVPFCRRTTGREFNEWVCSKHWATVPRVLKAEYSGRRREARKIIARKPIYQEYWKLPPGSSDRLAAVAMWRRLDDGWGRCKSAAIERAVGL